MLWKIRFMSSKGFTEDSQGRLWSLGEYFNVRYFDESIPDWIVVPLVGWGYLIKRDHYKDGTIWASTSYEILSTNGIDHYIKHPEDFPEAAAGHFRICSR